MDRLKTYMTDKGKVVECALERYLPRRKEEPSALHEAMRYSILAGGKRLRPLLCLMAGELNDGKEEELMAGACALEMIHTYSLIHDDLPAMDDDDYRRGRLSCHKAFGEALAILAGDALLTLAFETIARYASASSAAEQVCILAAAAGSSGMVGGQVLDLEGETKNSEKQNVKMTGSQSDVFEITPIEQVEAIHQRKTGALITASLMIGAAGAGAEDEARTALKEYGQKIGLAFQIKDDILDIESTSEELGKSTGKDEATGKLTYPSIMGMDEAKKLLRSTVQDAKKLLEPFGEKALMLRLLADFIAERKK